MQYRTFGKLDWKPSALGFGCMRLPTSDGNRLSPNINQPEAIRMIRHAIDSGVNYVDTAYPYHGGASETVLGLALRDGYRERVRVATKSPTWMINEAADFDRFLDEQLKKLGTGHIDFYLLHSLSEKRWHDIVLKFNLIERASAALRDGRIRHLGFSFHDRSEAFTEICTAFDWDFCQIQYNYMDIENQAGTAGLKLAASRGMGVVVMEPLLGRRLADPPKPVLDRMDASPVHRSPAAWALRWLWNQPEVSVVLSGMSTDQQVAENLAIASESAPNSLTTDELKLIADVREQYKARTAVPCTGCEYCQPCPNGVKIPMNFDFFNHAHLFDDLEGARFRYSVFLTEEQRASACIACKECEDLCPQAIPIAEWMPKVTALLEPKP